MKHRIIKFLTLFFLVLFLAISIFGAKKYNQPIYFGGGNGKSIFSTKSKTSQAQDNGKNAKKKQGNDKGENSSGQNKLQNIKYINYLFLSIICLSSALFISLILILIGIIYLFKRKKKKELYK